MFNRELFTETLSAAAEPYTLRELGELTGVSAPTISRLLRGTHQPDIDNFFALCAWMSVSPGAFMEPQATQESVTEQQLKRAMRQIAEITSRYLVG